ncbi:MAG: bifunctional demethylmenaquinone methyltransferase/2-methoxy-6-polyprenyl-1,4-benzoquinol methylase UbiE [Phycisphaerales bacterium]|nr:bifunctional demethylmenaquinone methyltransferase/2-methoxy-6-polyprenyl-1,4-benzoquinol methylase UbiE [Phycisphaerales bacterium]
MQPGPTTTQPSQAWTDQDLTDPHAREDKAERVRAMFSAIAGSYDLNNRVHSLWQDQAWRRAAVRDAEVRAGDEVLDCACGTGDLTLAFARTPAKSVLGLDFTPEMLDFARLKADRAGEKSRAHVRYLQGDAQDLPFDDASFDVVSIAFGIRNVQRPEAAIREFFRVLRPEGRLVILEFATPRAAPVRWFNGFYCGWVMPRTATLISRDKSGAYKYLPRSVGTFMEPESLGDLMRSAGFSQIDHRPMSMGICVRTRGRKIVPGELPSG